MDIGAIPSVLSGIKQAIDIARIIKDSTSSLEEAEIKLKLADLIIALVDAKSDLSNIKEISIEKDSEIRRLKEILETSDKLVWKEPYYFSVDDDHENGPYCQRCYDADKQLIRLQSIEQGKWQCKECENVYKDSSYEPYIPEIRGRRRNNGI